MAYIVITLLDSIIQNEVTDMFTITYRAENGSERQMDMTGAVGMTLGNARVVFATLRPNLPIVDVQFARQTVEVETR